MLRLLTILCLLCSLSPLSPGQTKSRSPEPAAAESSIAPTIKKLEQEWIDGLGKRDQLVVEGLLSADFHGIGIDGKTRERPQELATVVDTTRPLLSRLLGRLDVTQIAPTVAVARGLTVINGDRIREAHIAFTHVWVLRGGRWQVVAAQETAENF